MESRCRRRGRDGTSGSTLAVAEAGAASAATHGDEDRVDQTSARRRRVQELNFQELDFRACAFRVSAK